MNDTYRNIKGALLLSLLVLAVGVLPACGKKTVRTEIKQDADTIAASETVTPTTESTSVSTAATTTESSTAASTGEDLASAADATDTSSLAPENQTTETVVMEKPAPKPQPPTVQAAAPASPAPPAATKPADTPVAAAAAANNAPPPADQAAAASPVESTPVEASANGKGGFPWIWILLLILLAVGAWYYWHSKKTARPSLLQPHPPLGGLSPVSGFTGRRRRK